MSSAVKRRVRVAVLDDDLLVAESVGALLVREGMDVVLAASTWAQLVEQTATPADVVVLDLHLGDGILVATKIRALATMGSATVVVSRHADARSIAAAMRAGAHAFVAKTDSTAELVAAIRSAAAGDQHLAEHRTRVLEDATDPGLGKQEERALVLYASGLSIREVGAQMRTTEETVKSYIKRGRRKFRDIGVDVGTRELLRRHAISEGWLIDPP